MFKRFLNVIKTIGNFLQSPLLLILRLYWGYQFALTGFGKFVHLQDTAGYFQSLGIPFPLFNTALTAGTEMLGGILLILGLFSRLASIPLFFIMCIAFLTAHRDALVKLFSEYDPALFFQQSPFLFGFVVLIIFCFGPGKISLDYWLSESHKNHEMP